MSKGFIFLLVHGEFLVDKFVWLCWWNLSWYFFLNLIVTLVPLPSLFDAYFWNKRSESDAKGSGADLCRHHVTCQTAPCCGSVHFILLTGVGLSTIRVEFVNLVRWKRRWYVVVGLFVLWREIFIQVYFLCSCISSNVLIAWVQFHTRLVFQDHAASVKISVVSWLLLSSF